MLIVASELLRGLIYVATKNPSLFSSLSFIAVGGSKISPSLIIAARFLGLPVYEGYGLSECGSVVSLNTPSHDYPDSVGKTLPHIKAKIDDGEIIVENPIYLGYLGDNPLKADAALSTGDLGEISATGALKISGRKKNIIITSHARNISPEWIESHFLAQPEIAQVVVYGDGLPYPQALIVPLRGKADIAGAVGRANRSLPIYAQVKTFSVVPTFTPQNGMLTTTGRLRRAQILSFYKSIIEKESENDVLRQTG